MKGAHGDITSICKPPNNLSVPVRCFMPDMLAIVSKAVFESESKHAKPGRVLPISSYASANKHLHKLGPDGRLFLVTVRPPKEALWLIAVLEQPVFGGTGWTAKPNPYRTTDITRIKDQPRV